MPSVKIHDRGVKIHDRGVKIHDRGVKIHDRGVKIRLLAVRTEGRTGRDKDSSPLEGLKTLKALKG